LVVPTGTSFGTSTRSSNETLGWWPEEGFRDRLSAADQRHVHPEGAPDMDSAPLRR
jgi:hypothetical protein